MFGKLFLFLAKPLFAENQKFELSFQQAIKPPASWEHFSTREPPRWEQEEIDISFHVSGSDPVGLLKSISASFDLDANYLANKTNKTIHLSLWADDEKHPQIAIFVGTRESLWNMAGYVDAKLETDFSSRLAEFKEKGEPYCSSSIQTSGSVSLKRAVILVDQDEWPLVCLRRSLIHVFGLVGTLPDGTASILAADRRHQYFTRLDGMLLERLYFSD